MFESKTMKPQSVEEWQAKWKQIMPLLLEARDALPAISLSTAKLYGLSLTLADRIDAALEPWRVTNGTGI